MVLDGVGELYAACYRRLVARLYPVTGDLGEAEEVVQEAFVRALMVAGRFRKLENPEAWVLRVAVNLARTRLRRRAVLDRLLRRVGVPLPVADPSPDHLALMSALRQLPIRQRYALALHYLAGLPVDEVASTLNISVGTVKSRMSRGRAALANLLAEPGGPAHVRGGAHVGEGAHVGGGHV